MKTEIGQFCIDMLLIDAKQVAFGSRAYSAAMSDIELIKWYDDTEQLLSLGDIAARYAYHPDYKNWPTQDHTEHQNWPGWSDIAELN